MKTVVTSHLGYPEIRNIQSLPFRRYEVIKKRNIFSLPDHLSYRISGKTNEWFHNFHFSLNPAEADIYHLFNGISFNKKPWISTFETFIPRLRKYDAYWNKHPEFWNTKGVKLMAGKHCKRLIAISENSAEIQKLVLRKYYPEFSEQIVPKIEVIHPQQKLLINSWEEKKFRDHRLSFTLASPDFFNKGGKEILEVFDELLSMGNDLVLHLVSSLQFGDKHTMSTENDKKRALDIINKYPENIFQVDYLPNNELLELLKNTHIHFRTSYLDTYGFSVLEAQACGCPVISTNVRALDSINNNDIGYLIQVPKDEYGNGLIHTEEGRKLYSKTLKSSIRSILTDIISNPDQVKTKGEKSLKKIRHIHDPVTKAQRLEELYDLALS